MIHSRTHILKNNVDISRTNADSEWNPVYKALHRIGFVGTKQLVRSNANVILTQQTAASVGAWLREANAERLHFIFPCELAICA